MSPPEVWGPAVWTLFHTLIEKMNPDAYPHVINSMFGMIVRICKFLPCPDCSNDASNFLAKIKLNNYKTKNEFKNMLYLFHNWVNAKKRKQLYNHSHLVKYANLNLIYVINNFISKYNTKGNMKLLTESFQRTFVVKDFLNWFKSYSRAFVQPAIRNIPEEPVKQAIQEEQPIQEQPVQEEEPIQEEPVQEQPIQEQPNQEEQPVQEQEPIQEEEPVQEEPIQEEQPVQEEPNQEEEPIQEEEPVLESKKSKKKKNNKNKK